jgi:hypothetical protein
VKTHRYQFDRAASLDNWFFYFINFKFITMATIEEMKQSLVFDYKEKFSKLEKIAFELHQLGLEDIVIQVIKKMAGLKLLIDHCENKD